MNTLDRRNFLIRSAFTAGSLPLRSLITGLPVPFLAALSSGAKAQTDIPLLADPQYLIMSLSRAGDPVNVNAPGTYAKDKNDPDDPFNKIFHPTVAEAGPDAEGFENPVDFKLGEETVRAAAPWANLSADLRQRFAFWNHATFVGAHPEFAAARTINGAIRALSGNGIEELPSMIAEHTVDSLGCITREPISVGGTAITAQGRPIPVVGPGELKKLFANSNNTIDQMIATRDKFIDKAYAQVKTKTPAVKNFFDRYAQSKAQASQMGSQLGQLLADVNGNKVAEARRDQIRCLVALMKLNVAPVFTMGFDFGSDSHPDGSLGREVSKTINSLNDVQFLWDALKANDLQDKATFASLNTFGRNGFRNSRGGRDHNSQHHSMFTFGRNIKGGTIGGLEIYQRSKKGDLVFDYRAMGINSAGNQNKQHDIPFEDTFTSVGKTLAKSVGMENETINERIQGGKIITGALIS